MEKLELTDLYCELHDKVCDEQYVGCPRSINTTRLREILQDWINEISNSGLEAEDDRILIECIMERFGVLFK